MSEPAATGATSRRAVLAGAVSGWVLASLPELRPGNELVARLRHVLAPASGAEPDVLTRAREVVFGLSGIVIPLEHLEDRQILARIRKNIAADYRAGRTADVHGWRIAVTEWHALALLRPTAHV